MKALVMGLPRCRTSYLLDVICNNFHLENYFEQYLWVRKKTQDEVLFKKLELLSEKYKKNLLEFTHELHNHDNFGIKFFPNHVIDSYKKQDKFGEPPTNWEIKKEDLLDLETYFFLSKYDKIYFLYRENITDMIISYLHQKNTNKGLYKKTENKLVKYNVPLGKIHYNPYELKLCVQVYLIHKSLENYLISNNINYTKLEYNEIPNYVAQHYSNVDSTLIDTRYDYKSGFSNYHELEYDIQQTKAELEKLSNYNELFLS